MGSSGCWPRSPTSGRSPSSREVPRPTLQVTARGRSRARVIEPERGSCREPAPGSPSRCLVMTSRSRLGISVPGTGPEPSFAVMAMLAGLTAFGQKVQHFRCRACPMETSIISGLTGLPGRHLDAWLMSPEVRLRTFVRGTCFADIAIVEGTASPARPLVSPDDFLRPGELGPIADGLDLPKVAVVHCPTYEGLHLPNFADDVGRHPDRRAGTSVGLRRHRPPDPPDDAQARPGRGRGSPRPSDVHLPGSPARTRRDRDPRGELRPVRRLRRHPRPRLQPPRTRLRLRRGALRRPREQLPASPTRPTKSSAGISPTQWRRWRNSGPNCFRSRL